MPKVFECKACSFSSGMRQNYEKHLTSKKHIELQSSNENINITVKEITPEVKNNEIELLRLSFEQKIKEIECKFDLKLALLENKYELKISGLENKLLEYKLNAITQHQIIQQPMQQSMQVPIQNQIIEKQKILPITYIKTQMKNALTIKKTRDNRYENGRDPHGLKDIITINDLDRIMKSNYEVGIKPILNKILKHYGGRINFKIVCADRNRKRFFCHIEHNEKSEWIEDEYNSEIIFFLKCINYTLEALYMEWANKYNRGDMDLLPRISGALDETHENYCLKKTISMCAELLCISNILEDYNNGILSVNEVFEIPEDTILIPNEMVDGEGYESEQE